MTNLPASKTQADRGGVALWRRIADDIRLDIVGGKLEDGEKLPGEVELAGRFSANRHTVRRALAVLAQEGVVRAEQGRGTFVHAARRVSYRIGRRTRFSEGLAGQAQSIATEVLSSRIENASAAVLRGLDLRAGSRVVRIETVSLADGTALSRSTHWFPYARFATIAEVFADAGSITTALRRLGVDDYARATTRVSARHCSVEEARALKLAPGSVVLVSEAIDCDDQGGPIQFAMSRFPAERLELVI